MIYKTSEWVSLGHPDKVADYISEYVLDRMIEQDPKIRYAVEVQIKDECVSLAGEVTTEARAFESDIREWVKEAVREIGYTKKYQDKFGKGKAICADDLHILSNIQKQSPDIAQGVEKDAWGDQGIFFGFFCAESKEGQGLDYYTAKKLGKELYQTALASPNLGLDIKTQVTVAFDDAQTEAKVAKIIVAIPMVEGKEDEGMKEVKEIVKKYKPSTETPVIINGTGKYCIHGPIGDSGTAGRKLVVDFYGGRSRIGGGSPWTKDSTKADLTLNIFAHELAKASFEELQNIAPHRVETELSCCIGKKAILLQLTAYDNEDNVIYRHTETQNIGPSVLAKRYMLDKPTYTQLCRDGLFYMFNKEKH